MKIIRNGQEFELTSTELFEAYCEQEHIWDVSYVYDTLPDFEEYDLIPEEKRDEIIDKLATEMRQYVLRCESCSDYDALEEVVEKYFKEEQNNA